MVTFAVQPLSPQLDLEMTTPYSVLVSTKDIEPKGMLTPKTTIFPSVHPSIDAQVVLQEPALPALPVVTREESSNPIPKVREYGPGMFTETASHSREVYPPRARSSYMATDNLHLDMASKAAPLQRSAPPLTMEPLAPTFMQNLQTEIISFASHPTRPELTLEITPPEYGKVIVSAERESGGQVVVRLITETPQAKAALLEHLPRITPTLEVRVYTAEEYRDYRDEQPREQAREHREPPSKQGKREERVEFKI